MSDFKSEPLTDEEITGMKKYYENCMEPKPDVFALLATIDQLKEEQKWSDKAEAELMEERDELKQEKDTFRGLYESVFGERDELKQKVESIERDLRISKESGLQLGRLYKECNNDRISFRDERDKLKEENEKLKEYELLYKGPRP